MVEEMEQQGNAAANEITRTGPSNAHAQSRAHVRLDVNLRPARARTQLRHSGFELQMWVR